MKKQTDYNYLKPKKRFGQNFLQDKNILNRIIEVTDIKNKNVIEIGSGKGALTDLLIEKAKHVISYEIDKNLYEFLTKKYNNEKKIILINIDFLKTDFSELNYKDYIIVANIPYYITTDILFRLFEFSHLFSEIVLMVQKEYANRVCALFGTKDYGKLSITTSLYYDAKIIFDVSPKSFYPIPKVTSSVIHLKRNKNLSFFINNDEKINFINFINKCFSMKRKTLLNNLKQVDNFNLNDFEIFCKENEYNINIRAENLTLDDFFFLYKFIK